MRPDPPIAARILRAFERAAFEPDPIFPFSEGCALIHRHFGEGVFTPETRREITDVLWQAEKAVEPYLPEHFGEPGRLAMATETLGALVITWAEPAGALVRSSTDVRLQRCIARIMANDLDSICARIEIERSGLVPSKPSTVGSEIPHGVVH